MSAMEKVLLLVAALMKLLRYSGNKSELVLNCLDALSDDLADLDGYIRSREDAINLQSKRIAELEQEVGRLKKFEISPGHYTLTMEGYALASPGPRSNKILLIKVIRENCGLGLADAKDVVERMSGYFSMSETQKTPENVMLALTCQTADFLKYFKKAD